VFNFDDAHFNAVNRDLRYHLHLHLHHSHTHSQCFPFVITITNHIVDICPLTKSEGGPNLFNEADDDAVIWLESKLEGELQRLHSADDVATEWLKTHTRLTALCPGLPR